MSAWQNRNRTELLARIVLLVLSLLLPQASQAADRIGLAKRALTQLYPELAGKGLRLTIKDESVLDTAESPVSFTINVLQPVPHLAQVIDAAHPQCPPVLVSASFGFTSERDQRIFYLNAAGPVVNTEKQKAIDDLVDAHPEWSDAQVEEALTKASAKFGPNAKDQLLRRFPTAALGPLVGEITINSIEFTLRDKEQMKEHLPSANLTWAVQFTSHLDGQPDRRYFAIFEPFDGKLTSIGKIPPIP